MSTFSCPGCGQEVDQSQGVYIESGDFVCRSCQGRARVAQSNAVIQSELEQQPPKQHIIRGAISAFVLSIVSLFFQSRLLFFLLPVLSGSMAIS